MLDHRQRRLLLGSLACATLVLLWVGYGIFRGSAPVQVGSAEDGSTEVLPSPRGSELDGVPVRGETERTLAEDVVPAPGPTEPPTLAVGQLTCEGNPLALGGLRVLASPAELELDRARLQEASRGEGPTRWTETRADGSFRFEGLASTCSWSFHAGGLGFLSLPDSAEGYRPNECGNVRIPVTPVSGCRVVVGSTRSEPLELHRNLVGQPWLTLTYLSGPDVAASVNLMEYFHPESIDGVDDSAHPWVMLREFPWTGATGTLRVTFRPPGYVPQISIAEVAPWNQGYPTYRIEPEMGAAGLGEIRVALIGRQGKPTVLPQASIRGPTIRISGDEYAFEVELPNLGWGPHRITGIPCGDVRVKWVGWEGLGIGLPTVGGVLTEDPLDLELDLRELGELEVLNPDPARAEGGSLVIRVDSVGRGIRTDEEMDRLRAAYAKGQHGSSSRQGRTAFELRREYTAQEEFGVFEFSGPPYVIPGVPPGEYRFAQRHPLGGRGFSFTTEPVELAPGGHSTLDLEEDPR